MKKLLAALLLVLLTHASVHAADKIRIGVPPAGGHITLPLAGLRLVIEEAKILAKVSRDVSFSDVADLSMLRTAQRDLGKFVK